MSSKTVLSRYLTLVAGILILACPAWAHEIYSLLTSDCNTHQGIILYVDDTKVSMLRINGTTIDVDRTKIDFLLVHNTIDNPFPLIQSSPALQQHFRSIYIANADQPSFHGWPVKFIEDLVVFIDTKGRTQVVELEQISKLRPGPELSKPLKLRAEPIIFGLGDISRQCPQTAQERSRTTSKSLHLRPTRVLGDKIQISEFISNFQKGFAALESYEERTYLYAKPFLFETDSKLGFTYFEKYYEQPDLAVPLYFQWSTGRPYHFQSFNQIGRTPVEWSPSAEPVVSFRSELKSHFFHALFLGNLSALPAGTEFYTDPTYSEQMQKIPDRGNAHSAVIYNYMALMGGDFGPWSLSLGTLFPIHYIDVGEERREILASSISPVIRGMYTRPTWRLRGIYSPTERDVSENVVDTHVSLGPDESVEGYIRRFNFAGNFFRAGLDVELSKQIKGSIDQIFVNGVYNETLTNNTANRFEFQHYVTILSISQQFGRYVTLRGLLNWSNIEQKYNFSGINSSESHQRTTLGGTFEFVF